MHRFKELGQNGQNMHEVIGINSNLVAMQALVLSAKLPRLASWNARRREIAAVYRERLGALPLRFQAQGEQEQHVWHLFQIRSESRDALQKALLKAGIDAVVRYPSPIHLQRAFENQGWKKGQFPVAEKLARELLCLPIRPDMTEAEIEYVCETVRAFFGAKAC
jgi:dTDP-4-amino-4,6-dideoxygalactose transaminase